MQTGDQTLISMNNRWYLVERFDDADNHYQVEEFITKAEFEEVFKEIKANGRSGKIKSVSGSVNFIDKLNKQGSSIKGRKSSSSGYEAQYGREDNQIQRMGEKAPEGREQVGNDGNGDRESRSSNRQGNDVRHSRRVKETNNERSDEFRRIQEESLAMSDGELQLYRNGSKKLDGELRDRVVLVFRKEIHASRNGGNNSARLLKNTGDFVVYKDVDADLFHDIFEVNRRYL